MKKILLLLLTSTIVFAQKSEADKTEINTTLNNWHKAAATANFKDYFDVLTDDAIYIGTDATENWNKVQFQAFAKPYFDKGKAWNFSALERHIYFSKDGKMAWFDELLDTQMKICRGSGVLVKIKNKWFIKHYVLSMTIPNDTTKDVIKIKTPIEDVILEKLKSK
ncbi:nuclear transport factor 2 family protein [Flavobacterium sp. SUN052]|uniref:nuclear transport factor 2 family protein n=1 Tax=Flavobacterium sp. SUN052 TaxID=3002441 RepID=UPI00237E3E6A|nr:nuclear transport factor 2 family protein [Flavobacterium sp. SUN052]MEC4003364.1 nuclear transport factor 2 family protein [Flavobacterium sp. SUN052]